MAEEPHSEPEQMLQRGYVLDAVNNIEVGAAAGTAAYVLHKGEQVVSKLKEKVKPEK